MDIKEFEKKMGVRNYRNEGIHYSALSRFSKAPELCLVKQKQTWPCIFGTAFEQHLQAVLKTSNEFDKDFFIAETEGSGVPDYLIRAISDSEDIDGLIRYNMDGTPDKRQGRVGELIRECARHPGLIPIPRSDFEVMDNMAENLLNITVKSEIGDIALYNILDDSVWQKEFYLDDLAAMPDYTFFTGGKPILIDVKTAQSWDRFENYLQKSYWIQAEHYRHVCESQPMIFAVVEKTWPYTARIADIEPDPRNEERYFALLDEYREWQSAGCPTDGTGKKITVKL